MNWNYLTPYGAPSTPIPVDVPLVIIRKSGIEQEVVWKGGLWWGPVGYLDSSSDPAIFYRVKEVEA